jgi:hypothetical protein
MRLERLEKALARKTHWPPLTPEMSDEELAAAIERFLNGESLEAIARSQGRPWTPWPAHLAFDVTEDDLRASIRDFLDFAVARSSCHEPQDQPAPVATVAPSSCHEPQDQPAPVAKRFRRSNCDAVMPHEEDRF